MRHGRATAATAPGSQLVANKRQPDAWTTFRIPLKLICAPRYAPTRAPRHRSFAPIPAERRPIYPLSGKVRVRCSSSAKSPQATL